VNHLEGRWPTDESRERVGVLGDINDMDTDGERPEKVAHVGKLAL
jgi:hypothetical protein